MKAATIARAVALLVAGTVDAILGVAPYVSLTTIAGIVYSFNPLNPMFVFLGSWSILFINVYFGPLEYPVRVSEETVLTIGTLLASATVGFLVTGTQRFTAIGRDSLAEPSFKKWVVVGIVGGVLLVGGGVQSTGAALLSGNLLQVRTSFLEETNNLTRVGWMLFWPTLMVLFAAVARPGVVGNIKLAVVIILIAAVPLFSAGRQLYLQALLVVVFGYMISRRRRPYRAAGDTDSKATSTILLSLVALVLMVTLFRTDEASVAYFGDKLGVYASYSGVSLNQRFEGLYGAVPGPLAEIVTEYNYYYGAQLLRLTEVLSLYPIQIVNFSIWEKVPFLARNVEKLLPFLANSSVADPVSANILTIASFTWATSISGNLVLFGYAGLPIVGLLFGLVSGFSFSLHRAAPANLSAGNFLAANLILAAYTTMFSPLQDTNFFIYYAVSFVFALRAARRLK